MTPSPRSSSATCAAAAPTSPEPARRQHRGKARGPRNPGNPELRGPSCARRASAAGGYGSSWSSRNTVTSGTTTNPVVRGQMGRSADGGPPNGVRARQRRQCDCAPTPPGQRQHPAVAPALVIGCTTVELEHFVIRRRPVCTALVAACDDLGARHRPALRIPDVTHAAPRRSLPRGVGAPPTRTAREARSPRIPVCPGLRGPSCAWPELPLQGGTGVPDQARPL